MRGVAWKGGLQPFDLPQVSNVTMEEPGFLVIKLCFSLQAPPVGEPGHQPPALGSKQSSGSIEQRDCMAYHGVAVIL